MLRRSAPKVPRSPARNAALQYTERWCVVTASMLFAGPVLGWVAAILLTGLLMMAWTPRSAPRSR